MICYLDTSALVKLYIKEEGSDKVKALVDQCDIVSTSVVAYAEARAAFKRICDEGLLKKEEYSRLVASFKQDWPNFLAIKVSEAVINSVDMLADLYSIRGFDLLHLASAVTLSTKINSEIVVGCWDKRLWQAYHDEGFTLLPGELNL
jgi:uncharacterized protein